MAKKNSASSSVLSDLLSLTETPKKGSRPRVSPLAGVTDDDIIRNATRKKNTVTLGFDPNIQEDAKQCAELRAALEKAKALFAKTESTIREYGAEKRSAYNDAFRCTITTVNVPFQVTVPPDDESDTPGVETKHIQVVCTNKYSVQTEAVSGLKKELGDTYGKLFVEDTKKVLKAEAVDLFKKILAEVGLPEKKIDSTMEVLFNDEVKISTTEMYESEHKALPEETREILDQIVVRQKPGLKFP